MSDWDPMEWQSQMMASEMPTTRHAILSAIVVDAPYEPVCRLSYSEIAERADISRRTVARHVAAAKEQGWLEHDGSNLRLTFPDTRDGGPEDVARNHDTRDGGPESPSPSPPEGKTKVSTPSKEKLKPPSSTPPSDDDDVTTTQPQQPSDPPEKPQRQRVNEANRTHDTDTHAEPGEPDDADGTGAIESDLSQWVLRQLQDHDLQASISESMTIARRLLASDLQPEQYRRYVLDRLASYRAKVEAEGEDPTHVKSWLGQTRNVGWWLEDRSGGGGGSGASSSRTVETGFLSDIDKETIGR